MDGVAGFDAGYPFQFSSRQGGLGWVSPVRRSISPSDRGPRGPIGLVQQLTEVHYALYS